MKNVMKFSGFGVLFLVLVLLYLRYDKTGYYYGVECSFCNKNTLCGDKSINKCKSHVYRYIGKIESRRIRLIAQYRVHNPYK